MWLFWTPCRRIPKPTTLTVSLGILRYVIKTVSLPSPYQISSFSVKGIAVAEYLASPVGSGSAVPPPPPPPLPPAAVPPPAASPAGGAAAVFAQLNRGEEVTKGLRKVDKSEMTHKNPALRAGSVVPASTSPTRKYTCLYFLLHV